MNYCLCMKDLGYVKPSVEGCVYLLNCAVMTNPDYVSEVEFIDNVLKVWLEVALRICSSSKG